jgi:hypothetical protein
MGRLSMHTWWALCFPFLGGVVGVFFLCVFLPCSQCVPNMFSACSLEVRQVPTLLPKVFPIAPQFYPIWFAQSSALMYIYWKGRLQGTTFVFILQLGSKEVLPLGTAQCSKNFVDRPMNIALSQKKRKSFECTHELINY